MPTGAPLACPFCRDVFAPNRDTCPECGVLLVAMEDLPPTLEQSNQQSAEWEKSPAEDQALSSSARITQAAAVLLLSGCGLLVFACTPWVELTLPHTEVRSGLDLARGRLGWLWSGAVAQFLTLPLILTRRSLRQFQGVRLITGLFAALPLVELLVLISLPPTPHVVTRFTWSWGSYLAMTLSAAGIVASACLGGTPGAGARRWTGRLDASRTLH